MVPPNTEQLMVLQELNHMIKEFTEKMDVILNNSRYQNDIIDT